MESEKKLETMEEEIKLMKGELKQTYCPLHTEITIY